MLAPDLVWESFRNPIHGFWETMARVQCVEVRQHTAVLQLVGDPDERRLSVTEADLAACDFWPQVGTQFVMRTSGGHPLHPNKVLAIGEVRDAAAE